MNDAADGKRSFEHQLVDDLLPPELNWEDLVRTHPLWSLAVAALGGYFVGRRSGKAIVAAFSESAIDKVTGLVNEFLNGNPE